MPQEPTSPAGAGDPPGLHRSLYRAHVALRGPADPVTLEVGLGLVTVLQDAGATAEATEVAREIREGVAATTGGVDSDSLTAARSLVQGLEAAGDHVGALEVQQAIYEQVAAEHGSNSRDAIVAMEGVAHASRLAGKPAEAREMLERVLGARVAYLGERHPETVSAMRELALALHDLSDGALAADLEHRAAALSEELGPTETEDAVAATLPQRVEDLTAAASALQQAHELLTATYGSGDPRASATASLLGQVAMSVGDAEGAITWLEEARQGLRPDGDQARLDALEMARAHIALDHLDEAAPLIAAAQAGEALPPSPAAAPAPSTEGNGAEAPATDVASGPALDSARADSAPADSDPGAGPGPAIDAGDAPSSPGAALPPPAAASFTAPRGESSPAGGATDATLSGRLRKWSSRARDDDG